MLAVARGSHSCAAEIDLGTTTPRKKPGPENLGSGDETRELHKTRVFHQIFNAADGPEKSGFRACLTEIRPKPPSINPQTRKKSHNQNPGFARKTQVTHSPIPGLSRVSPRSRVFPGCLCCVLCCSSFVSKQGDQHQIGRPLLVGRGPYWTVHMHAGSQRGSDLLVSHRSVHGMPMSM